MRNSSKSPATAGAPGLCVGDLGVQDGDPRNRVWSEPGGIAASAWEFAVRETLDSKSGPPSASTRDAIAVERRVVHADRVQVRPGQCFSRYGGLPLSRSDLIADSKFESARFR
jgi:hypothetical protein